MNQIKKKRENVVGKYLLNSFYKIPSLIVKKWFINITIEKYLDSYFYNK